MVPLPVDAILTWSEQTRRDLPWRHTRDPWAVLVSETINDTLREADTACRLLDGRFALVLEDTSENGAIWTVERIRRNLVEAQQGLTLRAGIACYPAHAFGSTELLLRASDALIAARDWNQDRIEVASAES